MKAGLTIAALCVAGAAWAQEGNIAQVSTHLGEMSVTMADPMDSVEDRIRFEPYQMLDELFVRDDYVLLMRHGPTDWSKLDEKNVAPTDCDNQRIMSEDGAERMIDLGVLMAVNGLLPSKIVVSEWCRNQQTLDYILEGMDRVNEELRDLITIETSSDLNLLLSLQGAPDVQAMRERISDWDGKEGKGPLLLISHFTNIEELTTFHVYEGEMLMIDPDRDNRVLGYLRLSSAQPDIGHFNVQ